MVSNLQRKKIALNVRRDGPQPRILVRTFRSFTNWTVQTGLILTFDTPLKKGIAEHDGTEGKRNLSDRQITPSAR
jgi:hypothetical protein